jgi:hypothetical protein
MKYLLVFLIIVLVGAGVAFSFIGIPAPISELHIKLPVNVQG